ncbi:MAG: isoprenylcysteine carboxylmethyltransferase family protein [Planctomycetota bacterium]
MTVSASTPRLRLTLAWYLLLALAAALGGPQPRPVHALCDFAALLLVGLAVLGRIWCSVFIAGRKDAELVTAGPYAACRHPLYLLSLVGGLGLGLATHSWLLTLATVVVLLLLFGAAMRSEDALLAQLHGAAWQAWARATPRLWPDLRRIGPPATLTTQPRVLWKAFVDGGSFLLLLAVLVLLRTAREAGLWPTLLPLP